MSSRFRRFFVSVGLAAGGLGLFASAPPPAAAACVPVTFTVQPVTIPLHTGSFVATALVTFLDGTHVNQGKVGFMTGAGAHAVANGVPVKDGVATAVLTFFSLPPFPGTGTLQAFYAAGVTKGLCSASARAPIVISP